MYQNAINITNQFTRDPVPALIEKLSSEDDVKIKIQTDYDNELYQGQKKNLIQLNPNFNENKKPSLNFSNLSRIFSNKRSPNFPSQEQKHVLNKLKYIPCYTVVNNRNEIVMASPRFQKGDNSLEWLQNKYYEMFYWSGDMGSVSLSLFFMNKEDAATYLHEICKKEPKESEIHGLKIKTTGLDSFYKLNRTSPAKNQTRLVCDLQEIDLLLGEYINNSSNTVNSKQKYSNRWFQGTPVYSFKIYANSKEKDLLNYSSQIEDGKNLVFFTRKDAIKAWKCYLSKTNQNYYKNAPNLEIYNLESLLLDLENSKLEYILDVILIPPSSSIVESNFLETDIAHSKTNNLDKQFFKTKLKLKEFQRFYKGLIWLFTSDTLPSEENSW
jgi:hypothetical protein